MSTDNKTLLMLIQELEFLRAAERHFEKLGYKGVASELVRESEIISDEIIAIEKEAKDMSEQLVSVDTISSYLRKRLMNHFGDPVAVEAWLQRPNSLCGGMAPAGVIAAKGEGWILDATCNWPIEDTGRFPAVVTTC
jgi:hypothetical protein